MMQAYLRINGDSCPQLVLRDAGEKSHPANLVRLEGVVCCEKPEADFTEDDAWDAAGKVADLCRRGMEAMRDNPRNLVVMNVCAAMDMLYDVRKNIDDDYGLELMPTTARELLSSAHGLLQDVLKKFDAKWEG